MISAGVIVDDKGLPFLYPKLEENSFLCSVQGRMVTENLLNGDFHSFDVTSIFIDNVEFSAYVFFKSGMLWMVHFRKVCDEVSWADWSQAHEYQVKKAHDQFLTNELVSTEGSFEWGTIKSVYDKKSGSSAIVIKYK